MRDSKKNIIYLVHAEQEDGTITIEGVFLDDRKAAESLAISRGGYVTPIEPPAVYGEGNLGPNPDTYWPES